MRPVVMTLMAWVAMMASNRTRMLLDGMGHFQVPVNCTDEPSLSRMTPSAWNPGIGRAPPAEGAHETFTMPPGGTLLGPDARELDTPPRVQPVAATAVPPEFINVMMHVPLSEEHATKLTVTCAGAF